MNILILSAGTRNKIVEYFVKTLAGNGKVVATDMRNWHLQYMKQISTILFLK